MIDLHLHTTASDGTLSPSALVELLLQSHVSVCSITDHDTMDGVVAAQQAASDAGIECIAGIELSCLIGDESVHLLGYFSDPAPTKLLEPLNEIQRWRSERNPKMVAKLREFGFDISMNDVIAEATDGGQIGRPHIARAMIRKRMVKSIDDAFQKWLGSGKPAYIEKDRLSLRSAVGMVHDAGGAAVLAHPMIYPFVSGSKMEWILKIAAEAGVDGIEAYYPEHRREQREKIRVKARELGMFCTGGSDFHGPVTGIVKPGIGSGDLKVPAQCLDDLRNCITTRSTQVAAQ